VYAVVVGRRASSQHIINSKDLTSLNSGSKNGHAPPPIESRKIFNLSILTMSGPGTVVPAVWGTLLILPIRVGVGY